MRKKIIATTLVLALLTLCFTGCEGEAPEKTEAEVVTLSDETLSADVSYLNANDTNFKVTYTLKNGEFSDDLKKENVSLAGSFQNMKIKAMSASGKNLTLELSGKPLKLEVGNTYADGIIRVNDEGLGEESESTVSASIPVTRPNAAFDATKLTFKDGKVIVPLKIYGLIKVDNLTKETVKFEKDVTVENVTKKSEEEAELTLTVKGAVDSSTAANKINGQKVALGDKKIKASLPTASFYPVFDYVEKQGDTLNITAILYAFSGTFSKDMTSSAISYGDGFEKAVTKSFKRIDDTTAELVLSVPAGKQTEKTLNIDGSIKLSEGSLMNKWGDKAAETSYFRNYANENLGRDLNGDDLESIAQIVGGFGNTTFGTIKDVASGASTAYTAVTTILELTGVLESTDVKVDKVIKNTEEMKKSLTKVEAKVNEIKKSLDDQAAANFQKDLFTLVQANSRMSDMYDSRIDKMTDSSSASNQLLTINPKTASKSELAQYSHKLVKAIREAVDDPKNPNHVDFVNYDSNYTALTNAYTKLAADLAVTGDQNGFQAFDNCIQYIYNFPNVAYMDRLALRTMVELQMQLALSHMLLYQDFLGAPSTKKCKTEIDTFDDAKKVLDEYKVKTPAQTGLIGQYNYQLGWKVSRFRMCDHATTHTERTAEWDPHAAFIGGITGSEIYRDESTDFSDNQIKDFLGKMKGKTLKEELALAGFPAEHMDNIPVTFRAWKEERGNRFFDKKCYCYFQRYLDMTDTKKEMKQNWSAWIRHTNIQRQFYVYVWECEKLAEGEKVSVK